MKLIAQFLRFKGIVVKNNFIKKVSFGKSYGIALFPFIFLRKEYKITSQILRHEKIHLRQQVELLIFPFYIWYLVEFIYRFFQYRNASKAYRNISFEREAYKNDRDVHYLINRKYYAFIKHL